MKLNPRKIANSIVFLYFIFLGLISILMFTLVTIDFEISKLSQGFYSNHAISFTIDSKEDYFDDSYKLLDSFENLSDYIVYKELDFQTDIRGILYSGVVPKPPLLSGRFFEENDFKNNEPLAVIGESYRERMKKINDEYYIDINHKTYKVIGIMGYEHKSRLDRVCLLNLNTVPETQLKSGLYILDGSKKKQVNNNFILLGNDLEKKNNASLTIISQPSNSFAQMFSVKNLQVKLLIYVLFTVSLTSLSLVHYWYRSNENEINVMSLLGFKKYQIFMSTFYQFFKIIGFAFFICVILVLLSLLITTSSSYTYVIKAILFSAVATVGVGISSLLIAMIITHFQNIRDLESIYENDI